MKVGFSNAQLRKLATPIDQARVQTREAGGKVLSYIEGWFAISEANRIFGYDGWDREMVHFERLYERKTADGFTCGYVARVRVRVRAHGVEVLREGTGFGSASGEVLGETHERALKAAETDATKRALATFGGRFGLLLYDKEQAGCPAVKPAPRALPQVLQNPMPKEDQPTEPAPHRQPQSMPANRFKLVTPGGLGSEGLSAEAFCSGLRQLIEAAQTEAELDALQRFNKDDVQRLRAIPDLATVRGEHYASVLERLILQRRSVIARAGIRNGEKPGTMIARVGDTPKPADAGCASVETTVDAGKRVDAEPPVSMENPVNTPKPAEAGKLTGDAMSVDTQTSAEESADDRVLAYHHVTLPAPALKLHAPIPVYPLEAVLRRVYGPRVEETVHPGAMLDNVAAQKRDVDKRKPAAQTRISKITARPSIDKSVLVLASDRRIRSKAHLAHVAGRACVVCQEMPCHAHHVTFAQTRGLSQKVSDEFTVPLCVAHHNELHRSGSEIAWWRRQGIDPLVIARALWEETSGEHKFEIVPERGAQA